MSDDRNISTGEYGRIIQGIIDTIQRVYGDATQTPLDRQAAVEIWKHLTTHGVMPPSSVAVLVEAAGGRITVPWSVIEDPPKTLILMEPQLDMSQVFVTRR